MNEAKEKCNIPLSVALMFSAGFLQLCYSQRPHTNNIGDNFNY